MKPNEAKLAKAIGQIVRKRREVLKLSQQQLADKLGEHHTRISFIERGKSMPSIPTLLNLCSILEIDPANIMYLALDTVNWDRFKLSTQKVKEASKLLKEQPEFSPKVEGVTIVGKREETYGDIISASLASDNYLDDVMNKRQGPLNDLIRFH